MAFGVMRVIAERGYVPGRDIGIIGADDHPMGKLMDPPLTTFSAETFKAGKRMVQVLMAHLAGEPVAQLQEVWTPELIVRSSDGPKRAPGRLLSPRRSAFH
jgi:LacI family transcriptional regulator